MKKILASAAIFAAAASGPTTPAKAGTEPLLGDIMIVGFNFCPRGWAEADGQLLPINQNQSLYSLLGTQFGGDGRTTFALPDLRGRTIVGEGSTSFGTFQIGQKSGSETTTLTNANLPSHTHTISGDPTGRVFGSSNGPSTPDPAGAYLGTFPAGTPIYASTQNTPVPMGDRSVGLGVRITIGNTGGGQSQTNMQPFQVLNYCIATQGVFPSRN